MQSQSRLITVAVFTSDYFFKCFFLSIIIALFLIVYFLCSQHINRFVQIILSIVYKLSSNSLSIIINKYSINLKQIANMLRAAKSVLRVGASPIHWQQQCMKISTSKTACFAATPEPQTNPDVLYTGVRKIYCDF